MKVKINLEKIRCIKNTFGIGKDEIYFACFVTCSDKQNPKNTIAKKAVTSICYKITDGSVLEPVFKETDTKECFFDFDIPVENALFTSSFVLYENDGGGHYETLMAGSFDQNPVRPNIKWMELIVPLIAAIINKKNIPMALYDIAKSAITYFLVDDIIDRVSKIYEEGVENGFVEKNEIELNGCGGAYKAYITTEFV